MGVLGWPAETKDFLHQQHLGFSTLHVPAYWNALLHFLSLPEEKTSDLCVSAHSTTWLMKAVLSYRGVKTALIVIYMHVLRQGFQFFVPVFPVSPVLWKVKAKEEREGPGGWTCGQMENQGVDV